MDLLHPAFKFLSKIWTKCNQKNTINFCKTQAGGMCGSRKSFFETEVDFFLWMTLFFGEKRGLNNDFYEWNWIKQTVYKKNYVCKQFFHVKWW